MTLHPSVVSKEETKIFVIGFNKTGTSSLHDLFKSLNINSLHYVNLYHNLNVIDDYQAFSDIKDVELYKQYYERYPNSLFILNTRSIESWLISRYKHAKYHNFDPNCWCWPICYERTDMWVNIRQRHYNDVFEFFKDKEKQLLIVNIEKKNWENTVIDFLYKNSLCNKQQRIENRNILHHINVRKSSSIEQIDDIEAHVKKYLQINNINGDELLTKDIDIKLYNYKTYL